MSETAFNSFVYDRSAKIPLRKTGAKVIVEFRTSGSYRGEYGFDWIRMGDSGRLGDTWYANIMGNKFVKGNLIVDKTKRVYDRYASYWFKTKRFLIPWKTYGKQAFKYIAPVMTLRKGASAKLTLKVEVKEPAARMVYQCQTPGIFKLNKTSIPKLRKGKHTLPDQLVITCLKEFSKDQEINVYAYDANNTKHLAGKLIVKANDKKHQTTINLAIVRVIFKKTERFPNISSSIVSLKQILGQAYVNVNIKYFFIYLYSEKSKTFFTPKNWINYTYTSNGELYRLLDATILKFYPQLDNFFKIYYIDRYCYVNNDTKVALCGKAYALGSSKAIIFRHGLQDNTASHELLHCIGLPHSFSSLNIDQWGFAFKEKMTDNIMDYSDVPTIATWEYQWEEIHDRVKNFLAGK